MIAWFSVAVAAGPYVTGELSMRVLREGSRVPNKSQCVFFVCEQSPVVPLTYGASLILDQHLYVRARRTTFLNHRPDARPYAVDLRVGGWAGDPDETELLWTPKNQIFGYTGVRYVHHTGDGELLLDGYAVQFGVLGHYTMESLPDGVSGYTELSYFRYVHAAWARGSSRQYGGFTFRTGANYGPLQFGANVTADPGFGFSAMIEFTARGGISLAPGRN